MRIFTNVFFCIVTVMMIVALFSEIVVPLWRGRPFLPSYRKLKQLIRKTKDNVIHK